MHVIYKVSMLMNEATTASNLDLLFVSFYGHFMFKRNSLEC